MTRQPSPAEIAELFRAVFFVDARGRQVLEYLERRYCTSPPVETSGGVDAILKTYQRASHREVLDHIHALIARASADLEETPTAMKG